MRTPSRRDHTILGIGVSLCGALLLLSGSASLGVGLALGVVGIAVLANRPCDPPADQGDDGTDQAG